MSAASGRPGSAARNWGIDLLRLVSMFMICVLHVNGQGHAMLRISTHPSTYYAAWLLEAAAYCAVDIYGLISGYVGLESRRKPGRIFELWLTVFWYSALGSLVAVGIFGCAAEEDSLWKAIFPVTWKTYWYFSAYVGVFVVMPWLNKLVQGLEEKQCRSLMAALILVCSFAPAISRNSTTGADFMYLGSGYSFAWLAVLYVIGACLKKIRPKERPGCVYLLSAAALTVLAWASKITIENITRQVYGETRYARLLIGYTAPTMVLTAICLLLFFARLDIRGGLKMRVIALLSPMAFSVYLVQVQPFVWTYALKGACRPIASLPFWQAFPAILGAALLLYLICTAVDIPRYLLFKVLPVRRVCDRLGEAAQQLTERAGEIL